MVNKESEGKKLEAKLKHYDEEMIKLLKEKEHYQKELDYNHHQMEKVLVEKDHYQKRIKVLEEENIRLQNENERLYKENNDLTSQLKVIKKITEAY